ncbi:MAG: putative sulfate transporter [Chlamydiales bacterium]|nr:putative sulfate transporter [Chlamydiales bacterium]MCH9619655.1 putative sulfate transporter [Chlamydiales bacterium]MCH9623261.1 putative sulfate transporter [Chlamydiales bacterium]
MLTISPFPLWETLKSYQLRFFQRDLIAGLSVALLALPQAMAFAFVAGLPPQVGIFSAIFGTIFVAAFGASRFLISGPTTQIAILLQSGISEILTTYHGNLMGVERDSVAIDLLIQIVLIAGVLQIIGGLFRLGRLTQFASRAVLNGYMLGVGVALIMTQVFPFLGIAPPRGYFPVFEKFWLFATSLPMAHLATTLLGIFCFVLLLLLSRYMKKGPVPIIVFAVAAVIVYIFQLSPEEGMGVVEGSFGEKITKISTLKDFGPLYTELPKIITPKFEVRTLGSVIPLAFAICLLSVLQATATGRSYSRAKDPPYNDNQEVFALGIGNVLTSFFGALPSAGSFVRTEMNYSMRAKTRLAAIFSGIFLLVIILFLGPLVTQIPLTALAAMLFISAYGMLNFKDLLLCLRSTRADAFVLLVTFVACLIFSLDMALYIGIALSVTFYLKQAGTPLLVEYTFTNVGKLRPLDFEDERPDARIAIFQTEGELFFGAADLLQTKLRLVGEDEGIKVIILQLLNVRHIDASCCIALKNVYRYLKDTNRILMICGVTDDVYTTLEEAGLVSKIGKENFYLANDQLPGEPTRNAYAAAKTLLSPGSAT